MYGSDEQPFHYKGGQFITELTVRHDPKINEKRPYALMFGGEQVNFPTAAFEEAVMQMVTALYESGDLSMKAAEGLHIMALTTLQDTAEAQEAAMMEAGEDL